MGCSTTQSETPIPINNTIIKDLTFEDFKNVKLISFINHEKEIVEYYLIIVSRGKNDRLIYTDIQTNYEIDPENSIIISDEIQEYIMQNYHLKNSYNLDDFENIIQTFQEDEELNLSVDYNQMKRTLER